MNKIFGLFLTIVLLLGYESPILASALEQNNSIDKKLVQVELYSNEDKSIFAEVSESYKDEYIAKLNGSDFISGK